MPNVASDTSAQHTSSDGICPTCGRPTRARANVERGGRLLSFANAVRRRAVRLRAYPPGEPEARLAAERRCLPAYDFDQDAMPAPTAAAAGPTGAEPDPPGGLHRCHPRHVAALVVIVVAIFLRPLSYLPGTASPWWEILAMGLVVAVQYALLLSPFSRRTMRLLNASMFVIILGHRGPGQGDFVAYCVNLVLLAASAQALGIGMWRSRGRRRGLGRSSVSKSSPACPQSAAGDVP
jgi:hypothetical protein